MDGVGIDHRYHHQHQPLNHGSFTTQPVPPQPPRKRKADAPPENNERLSKRLSLLNLEQSGQKLYVPVENPDPQPLEPSTTTTKPKKHHRHTRHPIDDSQMQLDDSKYKVYIYNIDDELSSSDNESDAGNSNNSSGNGTLVFLPDIEKHLRSSRIPAHLLDPPPNLRANEGKELVLYSVPSSLSVPEEHDNVRKAIIEARARAREKQRAEQGQQQQQQAARDAPAPAMMSSPASLGEVPMDAELLSGPEEDPDAMELD